ncbi:YdcF family protein [Okeania sp. SIO1I7]|uniref:YdcF family protein n=1 Tax=Okeania sp. SIO1I7 TaxID=2607772 RepID=UPI0013F824B8|nr:YdcF family protein [Okeania sp. SIO1I7]NET24596.1 YdcF family protein [Okeania sp. SIO1I7]
MIKNPNIRGNQKIRKILLLLLFSIFSSLLVLLVGNTISLQSAAKSPVDTYLVLGGSIKREMYIAQVAKQYPQTPILISAGSKDPCLVGLFQRENAPVENVWLEHCAKSTFGNFYFTLPILKKWGVEHIKLVTSPTHLPRAKWLAQIILGANGIWVETDIVEEIGVPGNRESRLKTGLDVIRSLFWAVGSKIIEPKCADVLKLTQVNMTQWCKDGFRCEHQAKLKSESICRGRRKKEEGRGKREERGRLLSKKKS